MSVVLKNIELRKGAFQLQIDHLELQAGNLYALTGPNGAGKSTLLRTIALLERPDRGEVCCDGVVVRGSNGRKKMRRQVHLVEQEPLLFSGTVGQNLAYGLKLRGLAQHERLPRIERALELVALDAFKDRQASELSIGETRRAALARAVALGSKLLLLDEPTANIDKETLPLFEALIKQLIRDGVTILFSTHDVTLAERLGAEIIKINVGKVACRDDKD